MSLDLERSPCSLARSLHDPTLGLCGQTAGAQGCRYPQTQAGGLQGTEKLFGQVSFDTRELLADTGVRFLRPP